MLHFETDAFDQIGFFRAIVLYAALALEQKMECANDVGQGWFGQTRAGVYRGVQVVNVANHVLRFRDRLKGPHDSRRYDFACARACEPEKAMSSGFSDAFPSLSIKRCEPLYFSS